MRFTKRLATILLMLVMVLPAFGASKQMEISLLYAGADGMWPKGYTDPNGYLGLESKLIADFEKETGAKVRRLALDIQSGSTMSIDALVAAGIPPDVYTDFAGRVAKYMIPEYALDMKKYIKDIDDFAPSVLALTTRGGKVLALPTVSWAVTMSVNEDILAEVGYTLPAPKDWTIEEYLKAAALIKAKAPGKYTSMLIAMNQSSDQWWMPWFYAFGARVYAPGDYSKTVLNQPKALNALRFFQQLVASGYVPGKPQTLCDDDVLTLWGSGKLAFMPMQIGHTAVMESAVKQGLLAKPFKFKFIAFPHAKGEKPTPAAAGPSLVLVHKTDDEARNKLAARLAWYISGPEYQRFATLTDQGFPSRKSVGQPVKDNPLWIQTAAIIEQNGVCDFGITTQTFSAVRVQLFPLMAEMYLGKLTPEQVLNQYEKNVNDILEGK